MLAHYSCLPYTSHNKQWLSPYVAANGNAVFLLCGHKQFLHSDTNFVSERVKQSVPFYFLLQQINLISSSIPLWMWGMLLYNLINKIPGVISIYSPIFTDMLRRMLIELDTDGIFSFAWVFWSGRSALHIFHIRFVTM